MFEFQWKKKLKCGFEAKLLQRNWKRWKVKIWFALDSAEIKPLTLAPVNLMSKSFVSLRKSNMKHHSWKLTKSTFSSSTQSLWTLSMGCVWSAWKIKMQDLWLRRNTFGRCDRNHDILKTFWFEAIAHKLTVYAALMDTNQRPSLIIISMRTI